jgi:hypothetical protein
MSARQRSQSEPKAQPRAGASAGSRAPRAVGLLGVGLLLAVGAMVWMRPVRSAEVAFSGRTLVLPLPIWSVRLSGGEGHATYIGAGHPVLSGQMGAFRHVEQLGAAHVLAGEGVRLVVMTQKRTRLLTEMKIHAEAASP